MALNIERASVEALAPDAAAMNAAQKLARPGPWRALGHSAAAIWGECQGSAIYQTRVARNDWAAKCSCPSRKFPCKHALGLLLLAAASPEGFPEASEPAWVGEWLNDRSATQARKAARAKTADKAVDPVAQAARAQKRHANITAGIDQLDAWMHDLVRHGLARVQSESPSFWDAQARRMVDAQAPGLASRIRQLGAMMFGGDAWASHVLDGLGELALITHAYRRIDALEPALAADVRRLVGVTLDQSEVRAHGDLVEDDWHVLTDRVEEDERMQTQRAWLRGRKSGRSALVLQFAMPGASFEQLLIAGSVVPARLAFWPSAAPQRALVAERLGEPVPSVAPPAGVDVAGALDGHAEFVARLPWVGRSLLVLQDVVPVREEPELLADASGLALPLRGSPHDVLFALSGGHPITVAGEWNGRTLSPYSAWADGGITRLEVP